MYLRFNGRMMHPTCADKCKHFWQKCHLGLAAHEDVSALVHAACVTRGQHTEYVEVPAKFKVKEGEYCSYRVPVRTLGAEKQWYPLSITKKTCNVYWECDTRWQFMMKEAVALSPSQQIYFDTRNMMDPRNPE